LAGKCRQRGEHILDLEKNQSRLPPHDPEKRDKQRLARITQQSRFGDSRSDHGLFNGLVRQVRTGAAIPIYQLCALTKNCPGAPAPISRSPKPDQPCLSFCRIPLDLTRCALLHGQHFRKMTCQDLRSSLSPFFVCMHYKVKHIFWWLIVFIMVS